MLSSRSKVQSFLLAAAPAPVSAAPAAPEPCQHARPHGTARCCCWTSVPHQGGSSMLPCLARCRCRGWAGLWAAVARIAKDQRPICRLSVLSTGNRIR
jgi:hypothetical protein